MAPDVKPLYFNVVRRNVDASAFPARLQPIAICTHDMTDRLSVPVVSRDPVAAKMAPGALATPGVAHGDPATLLEQVMRTARAVLFDTWDEPLELISFHPGASEIGRLGLSDAQIAVGSAWVDNIYPADREGLLAYLQQRSPGPVDYRLIVGEGELLWVRHWTLGRVAGRGQRPWIRHMLMPVSEQKHLEWECLRVSERECNRIGQELHDDVCQVLAGLVFMMRVVARRARTLDAGLADEVEELNEHVISATDRVRSMAHGLFPAQLNFATLRDALRAFAAEAKTLFGISILLRVPANVPKHRPEQIIHIYRIVQEAVSNAVRHGQATAVRIALTQRRQQLRLRIEDNGTGFPAVSVRPEGIGLHVMQYRAHVLGGTFELCPLTPRGVAAVLTYPNHSSLQCTTLNLALP